MDTLELTTDLVPVLQGLRVAVEGSLQAAYTARERLDGQVLALETILATFDQATAQDRTSLATVHSLAAEDLVRMPRTRAVQQLLETLGRPMTEAEVAEALHQLGRDDPAGNVAWTLYDLARDGRAVHTDDGRWTAAA